METFGIIGMSLGTMGFIFGLSAMSRIARLEKELKRSLLLNKKSE